MKCKSILIIEDNEEIRQTLEEVLRGEGYQAFGVSNGKEALRVLKAMPGPALILLDMMMPTMNGWEFLEVKKSNWQIADLPVVVLSALDAPNALTKNSKPLAAKGYIRKPIDLDVLMEAIQLYCEGPGDDSIPGTPELRQASA